MKNIKDITISIFAIIGFVTIVSSFNNQDFLTKKQLMEKYGLNSQKSQETLESHVWSFHINNPHSTNAHAFAINKVTGEVRKYETKFNTSGNTFGGYNVATEVKY